MRPAVSAESKRKSTDKENRRFLESNRKRDTTVPQGPIQEPRENPVHATGIPRVVNKGQVEDRIGFCWYRFSSTHGGRMDNGGERPIRYRELNPDFLVLQRKIKSRNLCALKK
jgi:hypothetical protein